MKCLTGTASLTLLASVVWSAAAQASSRGCASNHFAANMQGGPGPIVGSVDRSAIPNEFLEVTVSRGMVHVEGAASDRIEWTLASDSGMSLVGTTTPKDRYAVDAVGPAGGADRTNATFRLRVPRDLKLLHVITHCAGSVVVEDFAGELTVTADSGDIVGTSLSGSTILEAREGGVELDLSGPPATQGPIHLLSHDGSITVFLPPQPSATLELEISCGNINSDFPFTNARPRPDDRMRYSADECPLRPKSRPALPGVTSLRYHANATLGSGAMTLRAMALQGDINIKAKAAPTGGCPVLPDLGTHADGSPVLATVIGRVFAADGHTPMAGAHLQIMGTPFNVFSDKNGEYRLAFDPHLLVKCHKQYIVVDMPGMVVQTLTLQLGTGVRNDDVVMRARGGP